MRLDSAASGDELQLTLHAALLTTQNDTVLRVQDANTLKWVIKRQLMVTYVDFDVGFFNNGLVLEYFEKWGNIVRRVDSSSSDEDLIANHTNHLTSLRLAHMRVNLNMRKVLLCNTSLCDLRLEHVSNLHIEHLEGVLLPHLKLFSLYGSKCSVDYVNYILRVHTSIQHLELSECSLEGSAAQLSFRNSKNLVSLGLYKLNLPSSCFLDIANNCQQLARLNIRANDDVVLLLSVRLHNLHTLRLSSCEGLTDLSLYYLALHRADTLQELRMSDFAVVRVGVFVYLLQRCTKMHTLSFNFNSRTLYNEIVPHLQRIVTLSTQYTVSDAFLAAVATHCTRLQRLSICKYPAKIAHNSDVVVDLTGGEDIESDAEDDNEDNEDDDDDEDAEIEMEIVDEGNEEEPNAGNELDVLAAAGLVRARVEDCPEITDLREMPPLSHKDLCARWYTAEGLLALVSGAPQLRLLCASGLDEPMATLGVKLWQARCPHLNITKDYSAFVYDVLKQPL